MGTTLEAVFRYVTAVEQHLFEGDALNYLAREAKGFGIRRRQRARDGPSVREQIRRALVTPALPTAKLTDCKGS